eukprot:gene11949-15994_t
MSEWNDTKPILHELELLFSRDDVIKEVQDIGRMKAEIDTISNKIVGDARDDIKALTALIASKEADIAPISQAEHAAKLKALANKENYENQILSLSENIETKHSNISKIENTINSLKERANDFVVNSQMTDSRTAYAISLYSEISSITWNYKATPGKLSGCIGNDDKKELKLFELDTTSTNSFEVANKLWALIEESSTVAF